LYPDTAFLGRSAPGAKNLTKKPGFDLRGPVSRLSVPGRTAVGPRRPGNPISNAHFLAAGNGKGRNRLRIWPGRRVGAWSDRVALVMRSARCSGRRRPHV